MHLRALSSHFVAQATQMLFSSKKGSAAGQSHSKLSLLGMNPLGHLTHFLLYFFQKLGALH
jgi:hypothetical protein